MKYIIISFAFIFCMNAHASNFLNSKNISFELKHGAQGTGNYKGKRDKHEKPGPQNEKKKKTSKWLPLKK